VNPNQSPAASTALTDNSMNNLDYRGFLGQIAKAGATFTATEAPTSPMAAIGVLLSNCRVSSTAGGLDRALVVCRQYGFQVRPG
jgi:hypothetical protein